MSSLESKSAPLLTTEELTQIDIPQYVRFFSENIRQLDIYTKDEQDAFVGRRTVEYVSEQLRDPKFIILVTKNDDGEILSTIEGEVFHDKATNKKIGLVRWIIVGKNARQAIRAARMRIGTDIGEMLEQKFRARGCAVLRAEIKNANKVSQNMSVSFGFKRSTKRHNDNEAAWYFKDIENKEI